MPNKKSQSELLENDRRTLGLRLKKSREYLELSQDEVAKQVDLPRAAISLIESGQRKIDTLELKKFAKVYQTSVSYLTGESENEATVQDDVVFLARKMSDLSPKDLDEVAMFAEFLRSRGQSGG